MRHTVPATHFFPSLIAAPFMDGLRPALSIAVVLALVAAVVSALRGAHRVRDLDARRGQPGPGADPVAAGTGPTGARGEVRSSVGRR